MNSFRNVLPLRIVGGALTAIAGVGMVLRGRWGFRVAGVDVSTEMSNGIDERPVWEETVAASVIGGASIKLHYKVGIQS